MTGAAGGGETDMAGVVKKALMWLIVAFFVYYLVTQPEASANAVSNAASGVGDFIRAVGTFFSTLAR